MRDSVIGSGAREHALAWALSRSPDYSSARPGRARFCAPGNAAPKESLDNVALDPQDGDAVVRACRSSGWFRGRRRARGSPRRRAGG